MTVHGEHDFDHVVTGIAREAGLPGDQEARRLLESVTGALGDFLDPEAWDIVVGVVPEVCRGESSRRTRPGDHSVADFFDEVAGREDVDAEQAALYARVVAETIRSEMTDREVDRLRELVADDFLALFEVSRRGELTSAGGITHGAREAGEGQLDR
jgi:uncharacterized protein (DUF2267 family)